ncbi:MAG: hypothetical protein RL154_895 [Pseudomonadota bacterium]|jgi:bis(5'-nucleosyl)-tetraphosphatase (symmetrical)
MTGRLIIYGDLHGCLDELKELRAKIAPDANDIEVSLGDVINKGKYSLEMINYLRENSIEALIGNHEDKFLRYRAFTKSKDRKSQAILSNSQREVYNSLDSAAFEYLNKMSVYKKFGAVTLIHGGITNDIKLEKLSEKERNILMHIRWVDKNQKFVPLDRAKSRAGSFWASAYNGNEGFVVYGHQPFLKPQVDKFALGIDTGCVYGNKLTAAIFNHTDGVVQDLKFELQNVNAHKSYEHKVYFSYAKAKT